MSPLRVIASTVSTVGVIWLTKNIFKTYAQFPSAPVDDEDKVKVDDEALTEVDDQASMEDVSKALDEHDYFVSKIENQLCTVQPGNFKVLLPNDSEIRVSDIVKCVFHEGQITNLILKIETFDNARITSWNAETNEGVITGIIYFNNENINDIEPEINRFVSCRFCKCTGNYQFRAITVSKPLSSKFNPTDISPKIIAMKKSRSSIAIPARLQPYTIPPELKQILQQTNFSEINKQLYANFPFMQEGLKENNYAQFLHTFLFLEEIEQLKLLKKYSISVFIVKERSSYFLHYPLEIPLQSVSVGDRIIAKSENNMSFIGKIEEVNGNSLLLSFQPYFDKHYQENLKFEVDFEMSRFTYRKLHRAVDKMSKSCYLSRLFPCELVPSMYRGVGEIDWINKSLNTYQRNAITNILRLSINSYPYIIFGPPGTGKTVTITELILQIYNNDPCSRVLVAVPTNSAATVMCQYIINSVDENDIIRLTSLHAFSGGLIPENIKQVCFIAQNEENENFPSIPFDKIGRHRITIGTFQTVGDLNSMPFSLGHFTHVIIDEAGQATECEALLPLILMDESTKIILSGDPLQLGPYTKSFFSKKHKLNKSIALRLMETKLYIKDKKEFPDTFGYDDRLVTKLLTNYRSLPKIVDVTSKIFYDNELIAGSNVSDAILKNIKIKDLNLGEGMISNLFINVKGDEEQIDKDMSYFNTKEAEQVALLVSNIYEAGLEPENIGIITPYRLQIGKIAACLDHLNLKKPKLCSVEEFQGDERDIIIVSLVRTNLRNISTVNNFIAQSERVNVALSRAKILNVVLGNRLAIFGNELWRTILAHYKQI